MRPIIKDRQKFTIMVVTLGLYGITMGLALSYRHSHFAPWFIVPLSLIHLYFYGVIHELTHNSVFKRVKANILAGYLLCPLNLVYFHTFKTVHLQHHRFAQVPVDDPVCTLNKDGKPFNPIWYLLVWPYYAVRWYVRHITQHRNRRQLVGNYVRYTAGIYALFGLGLVFGVFPVMLLYWLLPVYIGTVLLIGVRNLVEHYGCEASRYRSSRTLTSPLLNWLTFNSFLHLEHHLWPTATVAQLRELHERNRELYREKGAFIV
jgi:omega-6 fatty acid desaturase (delta-12 desaturase)